MKYLKDKERGDLTRQQYRRDIEMFLRKETTEEITKEVMIAYKEYLTENYRPSSVNVKLAAINGFLKFLGKSNLRVGQLKIQRRAYCSGERELKKKDYMKLIDTAEKENNRKLSLIIQTICGTGIRVSELKYLTVQAVRRGEAYIQLKGKSRIILIGGKLKKRLLAYIKKENIRQGEIFITRNKKTLDRSNIWKMMKKLCKKAGVDEKKVFPHNLRHLFARCFYERERRILRNWQMFWDTAALILHGSILQRQEGNTEKYWMHWDWWCDHIIQLMWY